MSPLPIMKDGETPESFFRRLEQWERERDGEPPKPLPETNHFEMVLNQKTGDVMVVLSDHAYTVNANQVSKEDANVLLALEKRKHIHLKGTEGSR